MEGIFSASFNKSCFVLHATSYCPSSFQEMVRSLSSTLNGNHHRGVFHLRILIDTLETVGTELGTHHLGFVDLRSVPCVQQKDVETENDRMDSIFCF
jgi:hypothetical protein